MNIEIIYKIGDCDEYCRKTRKEGMEKIFK